MTTKHEPRNGISALLSHGEKSAVPMRHIESMTGLDARTVRVMIERERRSGIPILSNNRRGGYYLPESEAEKAEFVRSLLHRSNEIKQTAKAILAAPMPDKENAAPGATNTESGKEEKEPEQKDYSSLTDYITVAQKEQARKRKRFFGKKRTKPP